MLSFGKKSKGRQPTKIQSFQRLKEMGVPVNTVIDVGVLSCTGSLMQEFSDRHHILIEPIEEFAPQIRKIYDKKGVSYDLVIAAMSDHDGEVLMRTQSVRDGAAITHARIVEEKNADATCRKVEAKTLETLVKERGYKPPFLLKVDVDGAELEILKGARSVLDHCNIICIEVGIKNIVQRADYIIRAGFQPFDIVDLCYYDRRLVQADMIFVNDRIIKEMDLEIYRDGFTIEKWEAFEP